MMEYDTVETEVGPVTVEVEEGKVVGLHFGDRPHRDGRRKKLPEARRWVADFFKGRPVAAPLALEGSPLTKKIYEVVRRIPRGKTLSYGEVADAAGRPGAARAVGNAMSKNPICLFIPCHRVLAANGIGGWGGQGIEQKRRLLRLEGVDA